MGEAMLYITAYAFLLRIPSEALPITVCMGTGDVPGWAVARMFFDERDVCLTLARRKNRGAPHNIAARVLVQ